MAGKVQCLKCGYSWLSRVDGRPKACPDCGSRTWDIARESALRIAPSVLSGALSQDLEFITTDDSMRSHFRGVASAPRQWVLGKRIIVPHDGLVDGGLGGHPDPYLALLMAAELYPNPRLFSTDSGFEARGGWQVLIEEFRCPEISCRQRIEFGALCAEAIGRGDLAEEIRETVGSMGNIHNSLIRPLVSSVAARSLLKTTGYLNLAKMALGL